MAQTQMDQISLTAMKSKIDDGKAQLNRLLGQKEELEKRLKSLGYSSVQTAGQKAAELENEIIADEEKFDTSIQELLIKYPQLGQ